MICFKRHIPVCSGRQASRPIRVSVLSHAVSFAGVQSSHRAFAYIQAVLFVAILATLGCHFGLNIDTDQSALYVSAQVEEGVALIVIAGHTEKTAGVLARGEQRWLTKNEAILLKPGDQIDAAHGVVLLTYFDGSARQLTQASLLIPSPNFSIQSSGLSIRDWFTRIVNGLNQPFSPNVTVASVLG